MERHQTLGIASDPEDRAAQLQTTSCGSSFWDVTQDDRDSGLTLLAVHAHPDDEASKGAATLARYADENVRTVVVTCTGGERGEVLNKYLDAEALALDMASVRAREMEKAAAALRLSRHYWLGFEDSGMSYSRESLSERSFVAVPLEESVARLAEILRRERPQVVITYDEFGGYPHPDHIRTHEVSVRAVEAASDPTYRPDIGSPHKVSKLYYHCSFAKERLRKLHEILVSLGEESPFEKMLASRSQWPEKEITTRIEISRWLAARRKALEAHESQIDPDSFFLKIPDEILAEALPTEDYHLAMSTVEVALPETDLFAGLR